MSKQPAYWNPFTKNPLNYLGQSLHAPNNATWTVTQNMRGYFVLSRDGEQMYTTDSNVNVCFWLNMAEAN